MSNAPYTPTPAQIRRACEAIRAGWDAATLEARTVTKAPPAHIPGEDRNAVVYREQERD